MAIGRISGPMLFSNLERQGVDLAFQSNLLYLDVNNLRVGVLNASPQYVFDSSGNVKMANIVILGNTITSNTGVINLGSTSNIVITGGSSNNVLYTDGLGNLRWGQISELDITYDNFTVTTGNAGVWYATTLNSTTANVSDTLYTGNFNTANAVISGGYINNLANLTATTAQVNNLSSANAVISGGYINSLSNLTATTSNVGDLYVTTLNATSANISGSLFTSNLYTANAVISGGYFDGLSNITVNTGNSSAWYTTVINSSSANIATGNITNFSTANAVITGGYFTEISNITSSTGNVSSWYATTLNSTTANITSATVTNLSTSNIIIGGGNVTANLTGNISGTNATFTGNIDASWFVGNVQGTTGNFGNINVSSNINVTGTVTATGNIVAQKITSSTSDLHISAATNNPNNIIRFDSVSAFDIPSGTTAERPPNPDYGYVRYNTDLGSIEWWGGSSWVAGANLISTQQIVPDGLNTVYTLTQATVENAILVNINGTIQQAGAGAYSVSGNQITFSELPLVTDIIEIRYLASGVAALTVNFANIASNVSPAANVTYDLGSINNQWANLHVGGNVNLSSTTGTPSNTASPASWLKIYVSGTQYFLPLYQ